MTSINDSVLLMLVGMLNFLGAIFLAHTRAKNEEIPLPKLEATAPLARAETVQG